MDDLNRSTTNSGFEFNQPTIISLLYLASCVTGITAIVGVVLAYVWRGEPKADWEQSHYQYLINTFWLGLAGSILGILLMIVLIGVFVLAAVGILVIVRCVMSLLNAQKHAPMPNPGSWLV
ncbi:DUF4870 family protein [Novosphingobium aerophilum]|uniref:DUF4870 family protein n=1 Tax=Novosphingobium TaxID=165696 RepID=UPI0006C8D308|nr:MULTISPECIES: hypothetical protein [unclassified Novosphingobium]KPH60657.1 membrane protein [Novosphingobium sp. ST904]MPS67886.1 hypothetical protein [Novosphingobium sp.]TCM39326.1 putative membrane protein [Novosphingobium sp. ST904]WRT92876.1 hypothetical protein U9J33_17075 [Novosphingobium sp. RL4]